MSAKASPAANKTVSAASNGGAAAASAPAQASGAAVAREEKGNNAAVAAKDDQVVVDFERYLRESPTIAIAVAAIQALTNVVKRSTGAHRSTDMPGAAD